MFDDLAGFISAQTKLLLETAFDTEQPKKTPTEARVNAVKTVASNLVSLAIYATILLTLGHVALLLLVRAVGQPALGVIADGLFSWRRPQVALFAILVTVAAFVGGMRLFQLIAKLTRSLHVFTFLGLIATVKALWVSVPAIVEATDLAQIGALLASFVGKGF